MLFMLLFKRLAKDAFVGCFREALGLGTSGAQAKPAKTKRENKRARVRQQERRRTASLNWKRS